ncbi:hypothetical protein HMPREF1575_00144 [Gardnerella vaginalis JCP7672]|nr:hypothetical protein HMPREF1575_00144 [Gardnerella vaginalis JCP7672]
MKYWNYRFLYFSMFLLNILDSLAFLSFSAIIVLNWFNRVQLQSRSIFLRSLL